MLNARHCTFALLTLLASTARPAMAQTAAFVPFDRFVQQLSTTPLSSQVVKPESQVTQAASFEEMRSHILGLYRGVTVKHSYMLASHPYDCIPIMQQPSVRQLGLKTIASPPAVAVSSPPVSLAQPPERPPPQIDPAQKTDAFGNALGCEDGTIPMRRVTLDDVGRFKSLAAFLQKSPGGAGAPRRPDPKIAPPATDIHKYAHSYQYVANAGGTTDINIWTPKVNGALGEVFSLAQFWYSNDTGPVQTVETGIQNYPQLYGTDQSVLFIYWTSDGYNQVGCYNLNCAGFVQTNSSVHLGSGFVNYSSLLGQQYYARLSALLQGGNWWIYLGGTDAAHAIGYYPAAVFHGTPIATGANEIDYGGEVVGSTVWPQMGSGSFAASRFRHASAQKQIFYYPDTSSVAPANLYADQPSTSCFTDITNNSSGYNGWNTFFYFGGPGGTGC